ncbi:hypothetical protein SAMN02746065_1702 [Desulfocicer vacuolatum DSM 3385]|uniref:Transposase DDE domain-containing protein n=1 Tax=Desulfocicer vacuolatum DSM 3385 TaxID=1121400 RepID=A0A1W2F388_9BACT|nr:hypothetical protein [Desulfocicer vacuolatum]SMD15926.1 hypothetical protein SAMN02746065_1702 [Desulfocicer vacuolatum DSM 3385]
MLTLVIRAKKNCVAYFEAKQPRKRGPGRPRQYGEKIKVSELFDHREHFSNVECNIYGKVEMVSIASLDLLWKPTSCLIRFVLAVTKRGPIILMCSDLNQDAVAALELYCARVRIETMFDMLKNIMGVFRYRFWTKSLERHSRKPSKNKDLKKTKSSEQMGKVRLCFAAYERFVMIGAIALGLLQLISIKYQKSVWKAFKGFLRTKSRKLPSERTVKFVIADLLVRDLFSLAPGAVIREIQGYIFSKKVVEPERQGTELKAKPETTVIET